MLMGDFPFHELMVDILTYFCLICMYLWQKKIKLFILVAVLQIELNVGLSYTYEHLCVLHDYKKFHLWKIKQHFCSLFAASSFQAVSLLYILSFAAEIRLNWMNWCVRSGLRLYCITQGWFHRKRLPAG